jgi:phosphate uptake regulator
MQEVDRDVQRMLELARTLFDSSSGAFLDGQPVDFDLYARDREINAYVIEVRKKIVEHLAVARPADQVGELTLITVINDIERVGDFSKNLLEISRKLTKPLPDSRYRDELGTIRPTLLSYFGDASDALLKGDEKAALRIIGAHDRINPTCEGLIDELMSDAELDLRTGIALALATRYFKRVSSHLKNVATAAVNPFILVGYRQAPEIKEIA